MLLRLKRRLNETPKSEIYLAIPVGRNDDDKASASPPAKFDQPIVFKRMVSNSEEDVDTPDVVPTRSQTDVEITSTKPKRRRIVRHASSKLKSGNVCDGNDVFDLIEDSEFSDRNKQIATGSPNKDEQYVYDIYQMESHKNSPVKSDSNSVVRCTANGDETEELVSMKISNADVEQRIITLLEMQQALDAWLVNDKDYRYSQDLFVSAEAESDDEGRDDLSSADSNDEAHFANDYPDEEDDEDVSVDSDLEDCYYRRRCSRGNIFSDDTHSSDSADASIDTSLSSSHSSCYTRDKDGMICGIENELDGLQIKVDADDDEVSRLSILQIMEIRRRQQRRVGKRDNV